MNNILPRVITTLLLIVFFTFLFFLPLVSLFVTIGIFSFFIVWKEWLPLCRKNYILYFFTPFYPVIPLIFVLKLIATNEGAFLFFFTFVLVATFDIASFIVGSMLGKHIIAKNVSPKKTWEGCIGGILALFIIGILFWVIFEISDTYFYFMHLFFIGIFAFLGDLFESLIKRLASVKDAGTILPGHGGLLDRFDSLLGAIIYVYLNQASFIVFFSHNHITIPFVLL